MSRNIMGGNHHHSHSHELDYGRSFAIGIALNLLFVIVEFLFGKWSNSVALVADAGHNLSDVLGLALAWIASILSKRSPTPSRTYGLRRSSILAAFINASLLMITVGAIVWEAINRLTAPQTVASKTIIIVAAVGIFINIITAMFFLSERKKDLNVQAAFTHLVADAVVSLGVALAGVLILTTGWQLLDPLVSLIVSFVIVLGTWQVLRDSLNLVLDAVPGSINVHEVMSYLENVPGCTNVHDLHIWAMSTTETALTAHLIVEDLTGNDVILAKITRDLHDSFGIEHATLQLENGDPEFLCHCRLLTT